MTTEPKPRFFRCAACGTKIPAYKVEEAGSSCPACASHKLVPVEEDGEDPKNGKRKKTGKKTSPEKWQKLAQSKPFLVVAGLAAVLLVYCVIGLFSGGPRVKDADVSSGAVQSATKCVKALVDAAGKEGLDIAPFCASKITEADRQAVRDRAAALAGATDLTLSGSKWFNSRLCAQFTFAAAGNKKQTVTFYFVRQGSEMKIVGTQGGP